MLEQAWSPTLGEDIRHAVRMPPWCPVSGRYREDVYRRLNYPALLAGFDPSHPLRVFVGVGAAEEVLAAEARTLYDALRATPGIEAELRVYAGGHDWDTWGPAFAAGRHFLDSQHSVDGQQSLGVG